MKATGTNQFTIHFDGGNDWSGYGSWQVQFNGLSKLVSRERYGPNLTCNIAEYMALIKALTWLKTVQDKQRYSVIIWSDSMLVVRQVLGQWKCKKEHLRRLRDQVRGLLSGFQEYDLCWHGRANNVRRFGH